MNKEFIAKVARIQQTLKAPKNQFNSFGKYNYRSCEDILEGLKNVLGDLIVTVSDTINVAGDRVYITATATITDGENSLSNTAHAREPIAKKGMDDSQVTGTASSYARKYALNGLFLIDDTKDADSMDNSHQTQTQSNQEPNWYNSFETDKEAMIQALSNGTTNEGIISALRAQGYAINKKITQQIMELTA